MELSLNDIEKQRNKKYGFNNTCVVLKALDLPDNIAIVAIKSVSMSYFSPSGRARLGVKNSYAVYIIDLDSKQTLERCGCKTKAETNKVFTQFKNKMRPQKTKVPV